MLRADLRELRPFDAGERHKNPILTLEQISKISGRRVTIVPQNTNGSHFIHVDHMKRPTVRWKLGPSVARSSTEDDCTRRLRRAGETGSWSTPQPPTSSHAFEALTSRSEIQLPSLRCSHLGLGLVYGDVGCKAGGGEVFGREGVSTCAKGVGDKWSDDATTSLMPLGGIFEFDSQIKQSCSYLFTLPDFWAPLSQLCNPVRGPVLLNFAQLLLFWFFRLRALHHQKRDVLIRRCKAI
ncbi:hypothetical protein C8R45DRAFT_941879 [Mycena sanguinolenta]|nr:hypothetical protein C8R45DRAFT_941879 [Mycena sanguinolenta]